MLRVLLALLILLPGGPVFAQHLHITTEEYPPYNFRDKDGQPSGVYMDQLKIIFERAHIGYDATILPWARALALAETEPMHCVVAAARTPQREPLFKWVSPIHTDRNVLVARSALQHDIKTLDDAKAFTVGTQRNDYTETILKSQGFPRIDLSADFDKTLLKLKAGRIDLMPMSESALNKLVPGEFKEVVLLASQNMGMACHRSVEDDLIETMQGELDELITDGSQRRIYEKYGLVIR